MLGHPQSFQLSILGYRRILSLLRTLTICTRIGLLLLLAISILMFLVKFMSVLVETFLGLFYFLFSHFLELFKFLLSLKLSFSQLILLFLRRSLLGLIFHLFKHFIGITSKVTRRLVVSSSLRLLLITLVLLR